MVGFQSLQFVHQRVVFGIADCRRVEHIVLVFVMAKQIAQCGYANGWIGVGGTTCAVVFKRTHGQDYSEASGPMEELHENKPPENELHARPLRIRMSKQIRRLR